MNIKYKITNELVNIIYEFSRLHGALYAIDPNHQWIKELKRISNYRSALSAVAIDLDYIKDQITKNTQFEIPEDLKESFNRYLKVKEESTLIFLDKSKINLNTVEELHAKITKDNFNQNEYSYRTKGKVLPKLVKESGIYRKTDYEIQTKPSEIKPKMEEFLNWLVEEYRVINPVIICGISHYKIAEIHPYLDGNGRLSRIFVNSLLYTYNIDQNNLIPYEEYFLINRDLYYGLIEQSIEENDLTEWLTFFAKGLLYSVNEAIKNLYKISGGTIDLINNKFKDVTPKEAEIINILNNLEQANGAEIARKMKVTRQNTNIILKKMIKKGVVKKTGNGAMSRYKLNYWK